MSEEVPEGCCPETVGKRKRWVKCSTAYPDYKCRCETCCAWEAEKKAKLRAQRKAEGRCQECGVGELASETYCQKCLDKLSNYNAKRRARREAEGLCRECGEEELASHRYCQECLSKDLMRKYDRRLQERTQETREESPLTDETRRNLRDHLKTLRAEAT